MEKWFKIQFGFYFSDGATFYGECNNGHINRNGCFK